MLLGFLHFRRNILFYHFKMPYVCKRSKKIKADVVQLFFE